MKGSWWKERSELDDDQLSFLELPKEGRYLLIGPPGSGKTNLLLLRAKYLHGSGMKNSLFVTLTKSLADFIRTGVTNNKYVSPESITTFRKWAWEHISTYAPHRLSEYPQQGSYSATQPKIIELLRVANEHLPTSKLYDAIFIDEVQDLLCDELQILNSLSENVSIAGDSRQAIYSGDALLKGELSSFVPKELKYHYRIGHAICTVADKLLPDEPLLPRCQYKEAKLQSTAELFRSESRAEQAQRIATRIQTQLKAYPGELIGIITPKKKGLQELRDYLTGSSLSEVAYHDLDEFDNTFSSDRAVHALTIHSAKGTEFRALHIFAAEDFKYPLHKRELLYTAVTRAKTSLSVHYTGKICAPLDSAMAKPADPNIDDLF